MWNYAEMVNYELLVELPDGSRAPIKQINVHESEKMLGVYSCPAGDDTKHLEVRVLDKVATWTARTRNGHLPSKLAWVSYRFKLWPAIRYGLATLATPLAVAQDLLGVSYFHILSFLGVNRNIKKGYRTIPRAFGGIGLLSFAVEQMICWLNMLIQHFGVPTILGRKFTASLEALQLEIGTNRNPLEVPFRTHGTLATPCWFKSFWERLHFYKFEIHLDVAIIPWPRENDALVVDLFLAAEKTGTELLGLNRCRIKTETLFLSDVATADGRYFDRTLLFPQEEDLSGQRSRFAFGREEPTEEDWRNWGMFWAEYTGAGLSLPRPLGRWLAPSHRIWRWFYDGANDIVEEVTAEGGVAYYHAASARSRTRQGQLYTRIRSDPAGHPSGVPVTAERVEDTTIRCREVGPSLASSPSQPDDFWAFLCSWGGDWMWEHIEDEGQDIQWMVDALKNGTAVLVTDGSFDRKMAPNVSGAGWVFCCREAKKILRGSFYELSPSASAYRGELLGLVAIHTLAAALVEFYKLGKVRGKICCDNIGALNQAERRRKRIKTGARQSDLLRALRTLTVNNDLLFIYEHVYGHQDRRKLWTQLRLEEQLNVDCDLLAKSAVARSMEGGAPAQRGKQLLPLERAAVFVEGNKITTDVAEDVRFCLGLEEARAFYTAPKRRRGGGLGWTQHRFDQVSWKSLDATLKTKPDNFGLWLSKQSAGVCATRANLARIQDLLDDKCPNCEQRQETASHLNVCPDAGRQRLFEEGVEALSTWMHQGGKTDPELAYWVPKYLLLRGATKFAAMGPMSARLSAAGRSQDEIGWRQFLEGKVSSLIREIQVTHCRLVPGWLTGDDWMKQFISRLLHISHSQWLFRNFTLHDQSRGYLRLQERRQVLAEIESLVDMDPDDVPPESRYLLEMDFTSLFRSSFERQSYWVRAMRAARRAGRRTAQQQSRRGASARRRSAATRAPRPRIDTDAVRRQIREELGLQEPLTRRRTNPAGIAAQDKTNKRLRKPD